MTQNRTENVGMPNWHGKPYYSLDAWCKNELHHKCYKVALNAQMTCPNRDGTLGTQGCIFCSKGGSGDFAVLTDGENISEQLEKGISLISKKITIGNTPCIIAYFQAYTNTYAPVAYLEKVFTEALSHPLVCGISIATRPDCLPTEVMDLLSQIMDRYPEKFLWIELGLQTIHESSAKLIRRGYELPCFENALQRLQAANIPVIVHLIIGLPGETPNMLADSIHYLNQLHPFGIKLQLLHILEDTDLADLYRKEQMQALSQDTYLQLLTECLAMLSPDIVVHRVTGDGPKNQLIAPLWSGDKKNVLNSLHHKMKAENLWQGKKYNPSALS